jgi:hypothetical protein
MAVERASAEHLQASRPKLERLTPAAPAAQAGDEQRRWINLLGVEFGVLAAALAATFASGIGWLVLPALLAVAIAGPMTVAYLAMSSDTNGAAASPTSNHITAAEDSVTAQERGFQ